MFVPSNKVFDLKHYFKKQLSEQFSESEIRLMFRQSLQKRLQLSDTELMLSDELRLSESDLLYLRSIVKRLQNSEPFQYILGESFFCDLNLKCDARALIPRPETEELVYWMCEFFKPGITFKFLDLCTGSGCIALGLKHLLPDIEMIGIDLSEAAVELASENAKITKLAVKMIQTDVFAPDFDHLGLAESFDCWVSNPPYIPDQEKNSMSENVLNFEPHMALFVADSEALIFYIEIAKKALTYLKRGGYLFFELHEESGLEVEKKLILLGFENCEFKTDLQGKRRMLKAQKA